MSLFKASVGHTSALNAKTACADAVRQALVALDSPNVLLAFIFVSSHYDIREVVSTAHTHLGNIPLFGCSTAGEISSQGCKKRSISVALISGETLEAKALWLQDFNQNPKKAMDTLLMQLELTRQKDSVLFLLTDGKLMHHERLCRELPFGHFVPVGACTGSLDSDALTYQIGGGLYGAQGLAAALIKGEGLAISVGIAQGWQDSGLEFQVSAVEDNVIQKINNLSPAGVYAQAFEYTAEDWKSPPLNSLVRLYPLGIETQQGVRLCSPLRVKEDGSFQINIAMESGEKAHLYMGSRDYCLQTVRKAAQKALQELGTVKPGLAVVFADIAWQYLFENESGAEIEALKEIIGQDVPVVGGYTFGQIAAPVDSEIPQFYNQHLVIVLLGMD